jgi:DNA-binding phage protein
VQKALVELFGKEELTMAARCAKWSDGLAKQLKDPKFAQLFVQRCLEEGLSLQSVLSEIVRAYGVKEFAAKVKMPPPNLLRVINPKHNPTLGTINKILHPFGLEVKIGLTKSKSA